MAPAGFFMAATFFATFFAGWTALAPAGFFMAATGIVTLDRSDLRLGASTKDCE